MLRQAFLALTVSFVAAVPAVADPIGFRGVLSPYDPMYSASSSPFEAFEWTPLDLAAFAAYGGDFANVRKPVTPIYFYEDLAPAPVPQGPDDEQALLHDFSARTLEQTPTMNALAFDGSARSIEPVPEPGALLLVGLGMLGASTRLRRMYRSR